MKVIAVVAVVALAVAGCGSAISDSDPMEYSTFTSSAPTTGQNMSDLLMPPTGTEVAEVPKGSLGVFIEDYAPQSAIDTLLDVYLPEDDGA